MNYSLSCLHSPADASHWAVLLPKRKAGRGDPGDAGYCNSLQNPKGRERWNMGLTNMGQEDKILTDVEHKPDFSNI